MAFPIKTKFHPRNKEKYIGDVNNIVARSQWEREVFKWMDNSSAIARWNSEETVISYYDPIEKKPRRYFVDLYAEIQKKDGSIQKCLIEIKPSDHSVRPVATKNSRKKQMIESTVRYVNNASKWIAANNFCIEHGMKFMLLCKDTKTNKFVVRQDLLDAAIADAEKFLV